MGVIGAGVMGSNHVRAFWVGLLSVFQFVGIADPDLAHRQRRESLIGVRTSRELRRSCCDQGRRPGHHRGAPRICITTLALACIARSIHVMVEKPIASTVQEGARIVAAAREGRRRR